MATELQWQVFLRKGYRLSIVLGVYQLADKSKKSPQSTGKGKDLAFFCD